MMPQSKLPKKTIQERENFTSYSAPCKNGELQSTESSSNARPLRVRFVLPEGDLEQAENTTSQELIAFPTLPSICEFTMFSSNRQQTKPEKQVTQIRPLTKLPPMYNNTRLGNIEDNLRINNNGGASGLTTHKNALANKGPVTCTKQDIRMEVKCKLPEDYRDPTYKETKKRIWDWLRQSEEHQPAYLRRANAFRKTVRSADTKCQTFQQTSLTQRI